jgi:iron uptake system component EfeO
MPVDRSVRRTLTTTATLGVLALLVAGCAADSSSSAAPADTSATSATPAASSGGAAQVNVTLTSASGSDACNLDQDTVAAGPVTFTVTNTDSAAITEVELLSDDRIIGEKENLAPGLAPVSFTLTLGGGDYQVYCPGAAQDTLPFTVTGEAAPTPTGGVQAVLKEGTDGYAKYVDGVVADMVTAVGTLKAAVDSGDLAAAQEAYAKARPYYERIESDVDGFVLDGFDPTDNSGNLDYLIDMRASNLDPAAGWHGFHAIERDLYKRGAITSDTKALAAELAKNVDLLEGLTKTLTYKPEDLANGAAGLLEEVQANKIKGEEELYSHIDLVDFAGNVEGAEQAFAFLKPGLTDIDPDLTAQVAARFDDVKKLLVKYEDPDAPGGYVTYTAKQRDSDAPSLSRAIQALQEPLAKIAEKVATAQ